MTVGTKSLLFGVHQFVLHPLIVAVAWWKLYGFPSDIRLWFCFFLHDIGYWGCEHMDDDEGKMHPFLGASIIASLFGPEWGDFCAKHSKHVATLYRQGPVTFNRLCVADKYAIAIEPSWLYLPRAYASGEVHEYMRRSNFTNAWEWHEWAKASMRNWVEAQKDQATPQP